MDTRNSLVFLRSCPTRLPGEAKGAQQKEVIALTRGPVAENAHKHETCIEEWQVRDFPASVRTGETSKEPKGRLKREPALISC